MINKIKVDGFKSLNDFELNFEEGLNVLVGPNGAGKTNICQSIELLSSLIKNPVGNYLSKIGGVGSSFSFSSLENSEKEKKLIRLACEGKTDSKYGQEQYEIDFTYSVNISWKDDDLNLEREEILIKRRSEDTGYFRQVLDVTRNKDVIKAEVKDKELLGEFRIVDEKPRSIEIDFEESQESSFSILSPIFFICHLVSEEISGIKSYNIDPYFARMASDISDPEEMQGNGKYLSNAINSLDKNSSHMDELNSILGQVIPNYLKVKPDVSKHSHKRFLALVDNNKNEFKLNSLSDGTIKLLGLLVGVISHKGNTAIIEEPENYIHPFASKLIIEYLRESFKNEVCILTTHSETILNSMRPEELIICEIVENVTKSSRLDDIKKIKKSIKQSGFGCGYHFVAGNLGGMPN